MGRAQAIVARIDQILTNVGPMRRKVVKRVITRTGDTLTGRTVTSIADSAITPQPFYTTEEGQGDTVLVNGKESVASNYSFVISPTAMTLDEITDQNTFLVLIDGAGKEERLRVTGFTTIDFQGQIVSFSVIAQTVTKQGA